MTTHQSIRLFPFNWFKNGETWDLNVIHGFKEKYYIQ